MRSSLQTVLPDAVSEETEALILEKIRTKMRSSCGLLVRVVRALEARFGKDVVHQTAREALHQVRARPAEQLGTPESDLADYVARLEQGCAGTHEWTRTDTAAQSVGFAFTACMWADVLRELDASDIGSWICEGDDPAVRSYNPALRCKLTRTLMQGDPCCDHVFHVAGDDANHS